MFYLINPDKLNSFEIERTKKGIIFVNGKQYNIEKDKDKFTLFNSMYSTFQNNYKATNRSSSFKTLYSSLPPSSFFTAKITLNK